MSELPPNVRQERRLPENAGERKLFAKLTEHEKDSKERFEQFQEDIERRFEHFVSYKALFLAMLGTVVAVFIGAWTLLGRVDERVAEGIAVGVSSVKTEVQHLATSLQEFKAESGAEVKGMYRFFLEKQSRELIKRQVEEEKRENAPPPVPVVPDISTRRRTK